MRIAVVGGGPGELFAAMLIKRSDPAHEVTVFERNRAEDTFGFGDVFPMPPSPASTPPTRAAHPLSELGVHWDDIEVRLHGERHRCGGNGMAAVERRTLLALLQRQAVDEAWTSGSPPTRVSATSWPPGTTSSSPPTARTPDSASATATCFCPSVETATAKFIWLGTTYPFGGLTFVHERGPHGVFAVHGYPIGNGVSTFIVETDERSWVAASLDEFDAAQPPGPSDKKSRRSIRSGCSRTRSTATRCW